jgi:hypothetical protein
MYHVELDAIALIKSYWVIQDYIYANLIRRYGFKAEGYLPEQASRFALYTLEPHDDRLLLTPQQFVSTSVDEVYKAMKQSRALMDKDAFVEGLNRKLQAKLQVKFE